MNYRKRKRNSNGRKNVKSIWTYQTTTAYPTGIINADCEWQIQVRKLYKQNSSSFWFQIGQWVLSSYYWNKYPQAVQSNGRARIDRFSMWHTWFQPVTERQIFEGLVDHKATESPLKGKKKPMTYRLTGLLIKLWDYTFALRY